MIFEKWLGYVFVEDKGDKQDVMWSVWRGEKDYFV